MQQVDKYLEKRGAKYFVTLLMFFYIIGTIIFNVYLQSLGSFEFEVLQLRYMFVGAMFGIITSIFPIVLWGGYRILKGVKPKWFFNAEKLTKTQRQKRSRRILLRFEILTLGFLIPWTWVYAIHIFPQISPGFGGARPIVARLIGKTESIKKINDLVAFETGVPSDKLPFEQVPGNDSLAIGANVKILDRNKNRIFLLLTKDLYLSSTSSFVKKLIDLGLIKENSFETIDTENLTPKPLIVNASEIEGITNTLFVPPEGTTVADLEIAKQVLMNNPDNFEQISAVISEDLPGVGEALVAAYKKNIEKQNPKPVVVAVAPTPIEDPVVEEVTEPTESSTESPVESVEEKIPVEPTKKPERMEEFDLETALDKVLNGVDSKFLNFRNRIYQQAGYIEQAERRSGQNSKQRLVLITDITDTMKSSFPGAWAQIDLNNNYLIVGQHDEAFVSNILKTFQGAEGPEQIIQRLNNINPEQKDSTFDDTIATAKTLIRSLTAVNTMENRKFVSTQLVDHFNGKAPREREYWSDTKYLSAGAVEERYFERLGKLLNTKNWEEFGVMSLDFYHTIIESEPVVTPEEEPVADLPTDDGTGASDTALVEDSTTGAAVTSGEEPVIDDGTSDTISIDNSTTDSIITPEEEPVIDNGTSDITSIDNSATGSVDTPPAEDTTLREVLPVEETPPSNGGGATEGTPTDTAAPAL